ncbi:ATP-binding protein [Cytobacillus praedii]|uniref:ATP-binding protein n=1 Tax=Cytobacillus praedii TaxID=1742358 RepID=UPI002E1FD7EE|nr:ATP-binding protein [Cytobacillus praedii]
MSFSKKYASKHFYQTDGFIVGIIALLTAVLSEVKVVPFDGEVFRFGLGSITFFLLILIWTPVSLIRTGIITGITVVGFRVIEDFFISDITISASVWSHLPALLFYLVFALGLHTIKIERYKTFPLILGAWATLFELIGNILEYIMRHGLLHQTNDFRDWVLLFGVALFRSYFVVGLYSSITVSEQKKRMQEMLEVGSELYGEVLYLQKSMNHIEQITAESFDLYRKLKKNDQHQLSIKALRIAQEIHEVKKDSQRILAGLMKVTGRENSDTLFLADVLDLVVVANEKYGELLKKKIIFYINLSANFETNQLIPLLALLNNLTANAVESINENGEIHFDIREESPHICFVIKDSGKGIAEEDVSIIFEPGYTTKFDDEGVAATGIGLSHVSEIVQKLEGQIQVETSAKGTIFQIRIPIKNIRK